MTIENLDDLRNQIYICTTCAACRIDCPTLDTILFDSCSGRGRVMLADYVLRGILKDEQVAKRVYQCTTCRLCEENCPASVKITGITEALRHHIYGAGAAIPSVEKITRRIKENYNPYGESHSDKLKWAADLKLPHKGKNIFYFGCTGAYRRPEIARSAAKILQKIGIDFGVLKDEWCCGSTLMRTGSWDLAKEMAEHNVKAIEEAGAERVIFSCAGCYLAFKHDYPKITDVPFELCHITELLAPLIREGELTFEKGVKGKVVYHDPCHLGRALGVYEPPREVLRAIPEMEYVEAEHNRENTWCCGGGGGVKAGFPDLAVSIGKRRVADIEGTGADTIVSACPFCKTNIRDAVDASGKSYKVFDITEIVANAMGM